MIIGAGKLGQKLAESMVLEDIDVTVVDVNSKVIDKQLLLHWEILVQV